MNAVMGEWTALLLRTFQAPGAPKSPWSVVFRDALLRRLVLRFILCRAALTLHSSVGHNPANLPKVFPELPKEVSQSSMVASYMCSERVVLVQNGSDCPCLLNFKVPLWSSMPVGNALILRSGLIRHMWLQMPSPSRCVPAGGSRCP